MKVNVKQRSRPEWCHAGNAEDNKKGEAEDNEPYAIMAMYSEGDTVDADSLHVLWEELVGGSPAVDFSDFRASSLLLLDLMYNVQFVAGANDDAWTQIDPKEHLKLARCIGGYVHRAYADVRMLTYADVC